ncbi:unnamed protein product [Boreogadus saida]
MEMEQMGSVEPVQLRKLANICLLTRTAELLTSFRKRLKAHLFTVPLDTIASLLPPTEAGPNRHLYSHR